ncbi:MAG: hypothetical protein GY696_16885 [Gammaproteobacteria bacterium]|nr:hypothetical protein [Gammaproteobacteria bacterium]
MCKISFASFLFFICNVTHSADLHDIRTKQVYLSFGEVAVASEGNMEPRSIGSYALRIYSAANPEFPYDNFIVGTVSPRDGVIERLVAHDFDQNGIDEIVVIIRSVGSGNYISAEAFRYEKGTLSLLAAVGELEKDIDPIQALKLAINEGT